MEYILMPQIGISEESAILTVWHVKPGDKIIKGDKLFSIETGKSAFDVESEHSGTVLALFAADGDEVAVKAPVCAVGEEGEAAGLAPARETIASGTAQKVQPNLQQTEHINHPVFLPAGDRISPRAKNLAEKLGVNPYLASATGPGGRIIERDIRTLADTGIPSAKAVTDVNAEKPAVSGTYEDKSLSVIRKVIAKNMLASLQNTAQLTHTASFDATAIMELRKRFKKDPEMAGVTLGDMILYAVTRVLPDFPALNAHLLGDTLRVFSGVNLAVAVDTERGLMVPVIFSASDKTLAEISNELKNLAGQCRSGAIAPESLSGGSFTVSNLGMYGIESFTPILNAPQTGILGVNAITQRVRGGDGCIGTYPSMALSLTYDHRAVDGAPASRFLQALCQYLENFSI